MELVHLCTNTRLQSAEKAQLHPVSCHLSFPTVSVLPMVSHPFRVISTDFPTFKNKQSAHINN
jgi:hypothetical protein